MSVDDYMPRIAAAIERACERIVEERSKPPRRWMTVEEVAGELRCAPETVRREITTWALPVRNGGFGLMTRRRPGGRGRWLICRHSLERMVERHWR